MTTAQKLKQSLITKAQSLILESGFSQTAIASVVGCSQQRVSDLVNGKGELFSIEYLLGFIDKFGDEKINACHCCNCAFD